MQFVLIQNNIILKNKKKKNTQAIEKDNRD